jgi:predicted dehydrogenase
MNVLIIGLGSIAKKHIAAILNIDKSAIIYALRREKSTNQYSAVNNIYELKDILNLAIDFAVISSPSNQHFNDIIKLLDYKIPLFIEKPLFTEISLEQEQLIAEISSKNILTYVACNLRFLEALNYLKNEIDKEEIYEVNAYCGSYLPYWRPNIDYKKVYSANADMGGGVHLDLIHEIDYLYWLFGKPMSKRKTFANKGNLKIKSIEYANYLFEYKNFYATVILNYYRHDAKRTLEVVCKHHSFTLDFIKNKVFKNEVLVFESNQKIIDTYAMQMKFFMQKIKKGNLNNFNTINEAYQILKICLKD